MSYTDAQVHLWAKESPDNPWVPGSGNPAHGDEYTSERLLAEMDAAGVARAILVPSAREQDRNDTCLAAAARYPDRFAVMGRVPLTGDFERERLYAWREQPGMLGLRVSAVSGPADFLRDGSANWLWAIAEEAGLPVMLYLAGEIAPIRTIAERHPGLRLIVDHLGLPTTRVNEQIDSGLVELIGLRDLENVAVKATCLPNHVTEPYPFRGLHDRVHRVVDAFSPQRVFWGSDLTRLRSTYDEVRRLFTDELDFLDVGDLDWIMDRGVREWLDWHLPDEDIIDGL
ncbi:MAG: amidohydrolase family protein [Actinomycetota bacterium]